MHIVLDFVWTKVRKTLKKRLLVLDEAWYMMKYEIPLLLFIVLLKEQGNIILALQRQPRMSRIFFQPIMERLFYRILRFKFF